MGGTGNLPVLSGYQPDSAGHTNPTKSELAVRAYRGGNLPPCTASLAVPPLQLHRSGNFPPVLSPRILRGLRVNGLFSFHCGVVLVWRTGLTAENADVGQKTFEPLIYAHPR